MDTEIANQRTKRILEALTELGSITPEAHLEAITVINPTANKPYHGSQHCITVALYSKMNSDWIGYAKNDKLAITLAGLYHDYNHISPDDNISRPLAVAGVLEHVNRIEGERRPNFVADISKMVEEARFAKRRRAPEYYPSRIIYDSDHMQILEDDFDLFLNGLNEETGRSISLEDYKIDLRKRKLFTRWAKEYALVEILNPERFDIRA